MVLNHLIRLYKLIVGFILAASITAAGPAHAVIIHRYLLDGNTNDSVGTLHLAAVDDFAPGFVADNKAGGMSAEFTGMNAVLGDVPVGDPLRTSVFSLAFWIKYGDQPSGFGMPIGRADGTNTPWVVQINPNGSMRWIAQAGGTADIGPLNSGGGDADPWRHVVISHNNDSASIYLDGVAVHQNVPFPIPSATDSKPLRLGRRGDGFLFAGRLDDVQIYSDALQPADVAFLFANPGQVVIPAQLNKPLELHVNRVTGETTLRNPSSNTTPTQLISYTLNSPANTLVTSNARWNSFQDTGKPGWFEANPTPANLSELASDAPSLRLMPGESHNFGTPFTVNPGAPLGTSPVDLTGVNFKYQLPDGTELNARMVDERFNDLVLVVSPTTGSATLQNQSTQAIELISYTISSAAGSLLPSFAGSGRSNWFTANPTNNNLSELSAGSSVVLNEGGEVELGVAWSTTGIQDLTFTYQAPDGSLRPGTVHFGQKASISPGLQGDYNGDGTVDAADYVVWRKNPGAHGGNPGGYNTWRANFSRTGGGGAHVAAFNASPAPEPTAAALAMMLMLGCAMLRHRAAHIN
jgi:hypothetical protein